MPSHYVPVSREQHGRRQWRRYDDYAFAREIHIIDVALAETAKVASAMPIVFVGQSDALQPKALMGLEPGQNLFVGSDSQWQAKYVPALLRGHPFKFLSAAEQELVLCIDETFVVDDGGEAFFADGGSAGVSSAVQQVVSFLQQLEVSCLAARLAATQLAQMGVIGPIPAASMPGLASHHASALLGVDPEALAALPDTDFTSLRKTGAIALAYHQLLSLEHWPLLPVLAKRHRDHADALSARAAAIYQPADDGELKIDWGRFKT